MTGFFSNSIFSFFLMTFLTLPAFAESLDARTQALSQSLRCPVCEGQSLWDSQTPMARDIQRVIYEKLTIGQSEDQIIDFLHGRYGDAIYLAPPP